MYVTNDVFRTGPLCVSPVDEKDLICIIIIMLRLIFNLAGHFQEFPNKYQWLY